ncbi:MAG TPA: GNAT family N-acetyltransferase [Mycobacteriales bacterium]|nr:GNAT family N-acetyltransferase [Mycobacteriales bacterium]
MSDIAVGRSADSAAMLPGIRGLLDSAFAGDFSDADWDHTLGGWHAVARAGDTVIAHAAVVPRTLYVAARPVRVGYVEGVATAPERQGEGLGSAVMTEITAVVRRDFDMGALSTSRPAFYERLGWERWRGPTYVRRGEATVRTAEEDAGIMVLRFGASRDISLVEPICCEERPGDDW